VSGIVAEKADVIKKSQEWKSLRRDHLPFLPISTLQSFGLSLGEALDFAESAKWILVQRNLEKELLVEENERAAMEMGPSSLAPQSAEDMVRFHSTFLKKAQTTSELKSRGWKNSSDPGKSGSQSIENTFRDVAIERLIGSK
jgi:hypothetical protein